MVVGLIGLCGILLFLRLCMMLVSRLGAVLLLGSNGVSA